MVVCFLGFLGKFPCSSPSILGDFKSGTAFAKEGISVIGAFGMSEGIRASERMSMELFLLTQQMVWVFLLAMIYFPCPSEWGDGE